MEISKFNKIQSQFPLNFMIIVFRIIDFENRKQTKFQINWSISFRDMFLINFNMQISTCSMPIRFRSKSFNIFMYKFQGMYNNFKYGFHSK